jgi:hypothetical protein
VGVTANVFFVSLWLIRFTVVVFRVYLERLRTTDYFRFLRYININDYEDDLIEAVEVAAAKDIIDPNKNHAAFKEMLEGAVVDISQHEIVYNGTVTPKILVKQKTVNNPFMKKVTMFRKVYKHSE